MVVHVLVWDSFKSVWVGEGNYCVSNPSGLLKEIRPKYACLESKILCK